MSGKWLLGTVLCVFSIAVGAAEYHVSPEGNDTDNDGSKAKPFKTIMRAAFVAMPGDTITVHEGVYREWVNPLRGGESDEKRIVYQAAPGENVVITGSEIVSKWKKQPNGLWKVKIPRVKFGTVNPYGEWISGDYIKGNKGQHTGMVYLDGKPIPETVSFDDFIAGKTGKKMEWGATTDYQSAYIYLRLPEDVSPNNGNVEINVRRAVFYPTKEHINYITVRGFHIKNAATNWAPPTAEQFAAIGTHWSKGWIIENNVVEYSRCTGISLGKYGNHWDNTYPNSQAYESMIDRAVKYYGWNGDEIGHHIVRNNVIAHCGQAGIVGGFGAIFSKVENNEIYDICVGQSFRGFETACIKFHGSVDVIIANNHLHHCNGFAAIWLDWMSQGTRVTGNLLHDNRRDYHIEVDHGPILLDNNLFLSKKLQTENSDGVAYVNNIFAGVVKSLREKRHTPYFKPHSVTIIGDTKIKMKDIRYFNNLFVGDEKKQKRLDFSKGEGEPDFKGNVYTNGFQPFDGDTTALVEKFNPNLRLVERDGSWILEMDINPEWFKAKRKIITTEILGNAKVPDAPFVQPDGKPYKLDKDFFGAPRADSPAPGPFALSKDATHFEKTVWPKK